MDHAEKIIAAAAELEASYAGHIPGLNECRVGAGELEELRDALRNAGRLLEDDDDE